MSQTRKRHPFSIARIIVSALSLSLFLFAFLATGRAASAVAAVVGKTQFFPSFVAMVLAGAGVLFSGWAVVLLFSAVFGRLYCSSLCPLGVFQDVVRWLAGRFSASLRRAPYLSRPPLRLLRFSTLAVVLLSAIAGSMLIVNLIEPYRFFGMIVRDLVTPLVALASHGLFYLLKPIGLFIAPMVVPVDGVLFIVSFVLTSLLVTMVILRGRWFCNALCPVGAALSLPAARSLFRIRIDSEACTSCRACERVCRAGCIDSTRKRLDAGRCVGCFDCLGVCSFDAIHYRTRALTASGRRKGMMSGDQAHGAKSTPPTKGAAASSGLSRRGFLRKLGDASRSTMAIFPLSFLLRRRAFTPEGTRGTPATPPGSGSIKRFSRLCISCHLCVSRCPTGVLQPSLLEYGLSGIMQPTMDFRLGFCEYECNECASVCPSGAILPIPLEQKKRTRIGSAHFVRDRCVVITNGTACGACAEVCPTAAVRMVGFEREGLMLPETNNDHCIGCGNCEFVCPVEPVKAIYVVGERIHGVASEPSVDDFEEISPVSDDGEFPF